MKAAILESPKKIIIKKFPKPVINEDQILIKIKEVGLCGSDVHYFNTGRIGDFIVKNPIILGHESSGIIEEIGKNVKCFEKGDRVTLEPGIPCYKCAYCLEGNYNLCEDIVFMATPPYNGAFVEYVTYDPAFVYKLPENVSLTSGALIEPLSVGYSACRRANIYPGNNVLITGSGPIGISILEISKAFGASRVYLSDINDFRLDIAKKHGAYKTINVLKQNIFEELSDIKIDSVIEASGAENSIVDSIKLVKKGGTVVWVGLGKDYVSLPVGEINAKDLTISSIFRYKNTYPPIINLLNEEKITISDIVTHRFGLDDIGKVFDLANNPDVEKMKIMIEI